LNQEPGHGKAGGDRRGAQKGSRFHQAFEFLLGHHHRRTADVERIVSQFIRVLGGILEEVIDVDMGASWLGSGSILPFYTSNKEAMVVTAFSASARSGWVVSSSKP